MSNLYHSLVIISLLLASGCSSRDEAPDDQIQYYRLETDKPIEEVLDDAIFAITERNFRLTSHLHIGKAIRDRNNPDFPDYEVLLYCNLTYAQKMLELDPDMINFCPGRITVRNKDGKIIIAAPLWPEYMKDKKLRENMKEMNILVREIVDYAADDWLLVYDQEPDSSE